MASTLVWDAADRVLVATDRDLDPIGQRRLPANVRHTGVVQTPPHHSTPGDKPLVLVSLSTVFFEGQAATLQAILDALAEMPIHAIVTTGAVEPDTLTAPSGLELHRYIPDDEIMSSASLVIGHGGHSTTELVNPPDENITTARSVSNDDHKYRSTT